MFFGFFSSLMSLFDFRHIGLIQIDQIVIISLHELILGTFFLLSNVEECSLFIFKRIVLFRINNFINIIFLSLNAEIDVTITFKISLNIVANWILLMGTFFIEHLSIKLLSFLQHLSVLWFHVHSIKLFIVHFCDEVLSLLEIIDSFVCSLLFFFQFYDAILYLASLVVHFFILYDSTHHFVLWRYLTHDWALSSSKICILWLVGRCWWSWLRLFHIDIKIYL